MHLYFRFIFTLFSLFTAAATFAQTDLVPADASRPRQRPTVNPTPPDNTKNAGKVEWSQRNFQLDNLPQGVPVTREFTLKNISQEDLIVLSVFTGCHCTVAEWPQEPIAPGQTRSIKVTFDAKKTGEFYKFVTVKTNFDPEQPVALTLRGNVL
jgi:Protein of unknown function (DUF1573)